MSNYRKTLGNWGERKAEEFLLQRGYTILDRNVRTPHGEIDLVVSQDIQVSNINEPQSTLSSRVVVFVEVKTRTSPVFGLPEESITSKKQSHLLASAQAYLMDHPELDGDWRVDVIAIQRAAPDQLPLITHFENAFV